MKGFLNAHYKRKIESLPQNLQPAIYQPRSSQFANHKSARGLTQSQIANSKSARRLAILVDRRNWAYHEKALEKAQYIGDEWQTEIFFLEDNPKIDPAKFDLLYNFNHTPSKYDELFHGRLIKGLYSHYYLGSFTPWRYIYRMVKHASVLVVANRQQAEEIRPFFRNTVVLPDGVDTQQFYMEKERTGDEIVAGWSENPDRKLHGRRVKRFYEVVEPSCKAAGVELRVGQNMTRDELRRMYNDVDVVLIGSVTEGNPLSLFEAGACGRTVIATRVGVVPEIIEDGYDGFLIDSDLSDLQTSDLLTFRLRWCREHPAETRLMGLRLREKILATRTPEITGEAFRELISNLVSG
ncbi:MAG TPA: glycosyltransferase family 4 protein [Bacteroidales bacterium]|jgi:glycosyltransferase involved in cell wall biosynthesis|nr:glycosyltransferase family 4 protein [Bacteroidales bacterium]